MKNTLLILLSSILLSSCLKDIDVKYPEGGGQLTLNCILRPEKTIRASLTSTLPYEQVELSPYYKDARLTLLKNGKVVDTLKICESRYRPEANDTVWIYCSNHFPELNSNYTLKAFKVGFPEVSGSTLIPTSGKIKKIISESDANYSEPFEITITDTEPTNNFYILQFQVEDMFGKITQAEINTEDPTVDLYSYYGIIKLPTDPIQGSMAFFTDQYFMKGDKKIKFRVTTNSNDRVNRIVLHTVSKSYYEYVKSLEVQSAVNENPFSEPVRIKSNISNGFGLFGASNESVVKF